MKFMNIYRKISRLFKIITAKTTSLTLILVLVLSSFTVSTDTDNNFETVKHLDIFYSLYKELNLYYVDPIVPGDIIKIGIDAMLKSLDPYTVYIPESQIEDIKFMTTGQYGGIGAMIRKSGDYTVITQPYKDSPADKSGVLPGDLILEINDKSIKGMSSDQVSELLRGEPNTVAKIKIKRPGENNEKIIEIKREEIKLKSVPYFGMLDEKTGYIALNDFTSTAAKEVNEAFNKLKSENGITAIVLDLRGNPGGLLIESVKIVIYSCQKAKKL